MSRIFNVFSDINGPVALQQKNTTLDAPVRFPGQKSFVAPGKELLKGTPGKAFNSVAKPKGLSLRTNSELNTNPGTPQLAGKSKVKPSPKEKQVQKPETPNNEFKVPLLPCPKGRVLDDNDDGYPEIEKLAFYDPHCDRVDLKVFDQEMEKLFRFNQKTQLNDDEGFISDPEELPPLPLNQPTLEANELSVDLPEIELPQLEDISDLSDDEI